MMTILIECFSVQFVRLWKIYKNAFFNDCKRIIDRDYQRIFKFDSKIFEALAYQNQQLTFFLFADLLNKISREIDEISLIAFDLLELDIDFNEYFDESNKLIRKQLKLTSFQNDVDDVWNKFNLDQLHAVDFIVNNVYNNQFDTKQFYFLNDFENTNKIFVQNIVLNKLRFENFIAFVVASFDIATTLLNKNQIAHFQFKISLNFDENNFCNISKNTKLIELIRRTKLIF